MTRVLPATHVLLPASRRPLTRPQLRAVLDRKVREILRRTCLWDDDGVVGDHRFCTFSYDPVDGVQVYMQFWSEPGEPVLWEVSSGNWHVPTKAYMRGERSRRVKDAGFRLGGQARNFQRDVPVEREDDIRTVSRQVVDLLYDAFGYRGEQPLHVQAIADTRAPRVPVYAAITEDDLASILERAGYTCEPGEPANRMAPVLVTSRGLRFTVVLTSPTKGDEGYQMAAFGEAPDGMPTSATPFADGATVTPLHFFGGVTAAWIVFQIEWRFRDARRGRRAAREEAARVVPRTAKLVH
jgi:hypothetical protein